MRIRRRLPVLAAVVAGALALTMAWAAPLRAQTETAPQADGLRTPDKPALENALALMSTDAERRAAALDWIRDRDNPDMAAALIQMQRFWRDDPVLDALLSDITGAVGGGEGRTGWRDWMLWQEGHPEVQPFAGFDTFKAVVLQQIDPNFGDFVSPGVAHEIRLEEIVWGGVAKDGIPALTNPKLIAPEEAGYLTGGELVFGVKIAGDARAYWYLRSCSFATRSSSSWHSGLLIAMAETHSFYPPREDDRSSRGRFVQMSAKPAAPSRNFCGIVPHGSPGSTEPAFPSAKGVIPGAPAPHNQRDFCQGRTPPQVR